MTGNDISEKIPFGLLELDATGTVIRYSPAAEQNPNIPVQDVLGRNFFTEIAPVRQVNEFQNRFHLFMSNGESITRFSSIFPTETGDVKVQILLARITERSEQGRERLALVRLMPEAYKSAA